MSRRHQIVCCLAVLALLSQVPLFGACGVTCDDGTSCSALGPNAVCECLATGACCGRPHVCAPGGFNLEAEIFAPAASSIEPATPFLWPAVSEEKGLAAITGPLSE